MKAVAARADAIPAMAGSYVLVLRLTGVRDLEVGALGRRRLPPGWYLYVGSARGPGGLRARLGRHLAGGGRTHWHIDYLRACAGAVDAWYQPGEAVVECRWAQALARGRGIASAWPGFGATDCGCPGHLFASVAAPSRRAFAGRLGRAGMDPGGLAALVAAK